MLRRLLNIYRDEEKKQKCTEIFKLPQQKKVEIHGFVFQDTGTKLGLDRLGSLI